MTSSNGGFLIHLDEPRRAELLESRDRFRDGFTDALSSADWQLKEYEVCGFVDATAITHWALAKRGQKVATSKVRVRFDHIVEAGVPVDELERELPRALRQHFGSSRTGVGGRVPPATWAALKRAIGNVHPTALMSLQELETERDRLRQERHRSSVQVTLAQQRDSLGLALEVFDATGRQRKSALESITTAPGNVLRSVLEGMREVRVIEDQVIGVDASSFPGSSDHEITAIGRTFRIDDRILEVMNVNRTPIESALGVDLLYFHHEYGAWTLVQYKVMEPSRTHPNEAPKFRPDGAFEKELGRMNAFAEEQRARENPEPLVKDLRLSPDGFYFKFCTRVQGPRPVDSLLPGLYLPRPLVSAYLDSREGRGPRGGRVISGDRNTRHLSNTLFAALVREGWIGTRGATSVAITEIVRGLLEDHHSVMIAQSRQVDYDHSRG